MRSLLSNSLRIYVLLSVMSYITHSAHGQSTKHDIALMEESLHNEVIHTKDLNKIKWFNAINPLFWIYKGTIGFYQKNISVQIAANCVFETSCSRYSKVLVNEFGLLKGSLFTLERLSRCNRISLVETSSLQINKEGKLEDSIENYKF